MNIEKLTLPDGRSTPLLERKVHMNVLEGLIDIVFDPKLSSFVFVLNLNLFHILPNLVVLILGGKPHLFSRWQ